MRNKVKRLLRAVMREYVEGFKQNYHIVIVPKPSNEYSYHVFKEDVFYLLNKENLLND